MERLSSLMCLATDVFLLAWFWQASATVTPSSNECFRFSCKSRDPIMRVSLCNQAALMDCICEELETMRM